MYWFAAHVTPFTYGALGACVHVLRMTEKHLRDRTFDPRRIPQHRNRIVLGTLSGGIITMFMNTSNGTGSDVVLTAAAMGFLAGYSIDFLFSILDRILQAIMPPGSNTNNTRTFQETFSHDAMETSQNYTQDMMDKISASYKKQPLPINTGKPSTENTPPTTTISISQSIISHPSAIVSHRLIRDR